MKLIDNFLEPFYFDYLFNCVNNQSFQWKYQKNVSVFNGDDDGWLHGLSHGLYDPQYGLDFQTEKSEIWIPAILKIEQDLIGEKASLVRARLDMTVKSPPGTIHTPHQDIKQPHWTTIFYLTDSDGDTIIYNETTSSDTYTEKHRITPKKNRIICFDGAHFHTGHSPSKCSNRILLNANFIK